MGLKAKKKNRGITLIEVIVVIAILAIVVAMATVSISLMFSKDTEKCAKTIDNQLSNLRMMSMSKEGLWYMVIVNTGTEHSVSIYCDANGTTTLVEKEELQKRVLLSYSGITESNAPYLKINFDKSNGSIKGIIGRNTMAEILSQTQVAPSLFQITVTNNKGTKHTRINMVKTTGKHYLE